MTTTSHSRDSATGSHIKKSVDEVARIGFSYERVSTKSQVDGVGLGRQHDAFVPFCQRHGLVANADPIRDEGLSAFHGTHKSKGALGAFIQARRDDLIPAGSVLVVEEWDRFSRQTTSVSERMLRELWDLDLALGIVTQDVIVTEDKYNQDVGLSVMLKCLQKESNAESSKKSRRIKHVWQERRDLFQNEGQKFLSLSDAPKWLAIGENDFVPGPLAETIKLIFELGARQGMSSVQIAEELNRRGLSTATGGTWGNANVCKVLRNDQVMGHKCWGDGIISQGYYPVIVDAKTVELARENVRRRYSAPARGRTTRKNGELGPCRNIFKGLTYCCCGAPMVDTSSHSGKYLDLVCSAQNDGRDCIVKSKQRWKVDEELLLRAFMGRRWERFFKNPSTGPRIRDLQNRLLEEEQLAGELRTQAEAAEYNASKAFTQADADKDLLKFYGELALKAKKQANAAEDKTKQTKAELEVFQALPDGADMKEQIRIKVEEFLSLPNRADRDVRNKFNQWVQTLGARIIFMSTNPVHVRITLKDLPIDHGWRELRPDVNDKQLLNSIDDVYLYRQGDDFVVDQTVQDIAELGATRQQVKEQREKLEALIPTPKRLNYPTYSEEEAEPAKRRRPVR